MVSGLWSPVYGPRSVVLGLWSPVYGPRSVVPCLWSPVYGSPSVVSGLLSPVCGPRSMVPVCGLRSMVPDIWSLVYGPWSMIQVGGRNPVLSARQLRFSSTPLSYRPAGCGGAATAATAATAAAAAALPHPVPHVLSGSVRPGESGESGESEGVPLFVCLVDLRDDVCTRSDCRVSARRLWAPDRSETVVWFAVSCRVAVTGSLMIGQGETARRLLCEVYMPFLCFLWVTVI